MSLPKRATKRPRAPVRRAGARGQSVASSPRAVSANADTAEPDARRLTAAFERAIADGKFDVVDAAVLQSLLAAACRLYAARREAGEEFLPVARNTVAATDVMLSASGLLRSADLGAFELGMWQGWTGR